MPAKIWDHYDCCYKFVCGSCYRKYILEVQAIECEKNDRRPLSKRDFNPFEILLEGVEGRL